MPGIKEILAGMGITSENKPAESTNEMTAEKLVELTTKSVVEELRSAGRLVDNPTQGNPAPGGNPTPTDAVTWDNLDVNTEAGKEAFNNYLTEHGKTVFKIDA